MCFSGLVFNMPKTIRQIMEVEICCITLRENTKGFTRHQRLAKTPDNKWNYYLRLITVRLTSVAIQKQK